MIRPSYTSPQYFSHLAQKLKNVVGGLELVSWYRSVLAGKIYQLADGDSYQKSEIKNTLFDPRHLNTISQNKSL